MILRRLTKGVGANALGQLVNTGLQLAIVPILATHWGLERYGTWLMIATIPFYLLVSDLGFAKACAVDMTLRMTRGDKAGALATFQTAWAFAICMTVTLLAIILLACSLLPDSLFASAASSAGEVRLAVALMSTYGVMILNCMVFSGGYQSTGNYPTDVTLGACMWLAEGVSAIIVAASGGGLVAVAASYLICRMIGLVVFATVMHRIAPGIHIGLRHANRADARRLLPPALAIMAVPMAQSAILQGTALAIGAAASAAAVPAFTTTRTLTRFGIQLIGIVSRASLPEFSMASAREDRQLQVRLILLVLVSSVMLLAPIAVILLVAGPKIIALWTHGVVHVSPLMVGLMTAVMLANGAWAPVSNMIVAVNRQGLFTHKYVVMAILSIPLTYFLAGHIGAIGGGIAMLVIDLVMCVIIARLITRLFVAPRELLRTAPLVWADGRALYGRLRSR